MNTMVEARNVETPADVTQAISANHLRKSFGTVVAVDEVSLNVAPGEVVAFLGPNGAGKTSTIDMILGLSTPESGSVSVFGMTPRQAIGRGLVSAVLQTGGLLKDITVLDTVRLTASLFPNSQKPEEVLERAGILGIAGHRVEKCSGGEQQRLRFALALLSDPGVLILDEPTTGMDVVGRRQFWNAIHEDARRGRTVVFATHYLEEADEYADRIVLIRKGQIVADGTAAEIKNIVGGRTVRAQLAGADQARLASLENVDSVEVQGDRLTVRTTDSDALVRYLLQNTNARDVTVGSHNLEDAFVALTGENEEN